MSVTTDNQLMTVKDLELPGAPEKFVELVRGYLVQTLPPSWWHNDVAMNVVHTFRDFFEPRPNLSFCGSNSGFFLESNPDTLLSPDAALFTERPSETELWYEHAPEIVVEVQDKFNNEMEMILKREYYFRLGAQQFWLFDSEHGTLDIFFHDRRRVSASKEDCVRCEGIADGLDLDLPAIFAKRR